MNFKFHDTKYSMKNNLRLLHILISIVNVNQILLLVQSIKKPTPVKMKTIMKKKIQFILGRRR